jgi:hypothetical protein
VLIVCGSSAYASADEAWRAYLAKDYARAVELAQTPAADGNKDAQYLLGLAAKHGRGNEQNHEVAVKWFTLAAERGHADALNDLATSFSRGEGVAKDDVKAFEYFRLAAERGSPAGQRNVGKMYEHGIGVEKDSLKALYWYERTDASLYRRELREKSRQRPTRNVFPPKKLPDRCRPIAPPVREMNRAQVDVLSGYIDFYIDDKGKARGVNVNELTHEDFRFLVVALFSKSLRSDDCTFGDGVVGIEMRAPFKFALTN